MESTNLHQSQCYHLQEDQFLQRHSSSADDPSPSIFLKGGLLHNNPLMEAEVQNNTKEFLWPTKFSSEEGHHSHNHHPHLNIPIPPIVTTQNLMAFDTSRSFFNVYQQEALSSKGGEQLHGKAMKDENNISDYSLPRLSEEEEDASNRQRQEQPYYFPQSNLWSTPINNFSSSTYTCQSSNNTTRLGGVVSANGVYVNPNNPQGEHFSGSLLGHNFLGLNLSSFDHLLASTRNNIYMDDKVPKENQRTYWGQDGRPIMSRLLRDHHTSSNNTLKLFNNGSSKISKKSSSYSSTTAKKPQVEAKKCRVSSCSSSCPPVKVSTENIRNRVAALQRLVAPFGKTDTASVLTEAIGYIQFLHDQVQTLSVPYMNSALSQAKHSRKMENDLGQKIPNNHVERDLRSRGLCLVPISYASFINDCEEGMWMHP